MQDNIEYKIDFSKLTGKGVKVAVIDSGLDISHPNLFKSLKGGISFFKNKNDDIVELPDTDDKIGHGTACASIILHKSPEIHLYVAKVFQDELQVSTPILLKALEWCDKQEINVVNLSLGTNRAEWFRPLSAVCEHLAQKGTIVIAAEGTPGVKCWPAYLSSTIGVTGGPVRGKYAYYYHKGKPIEVTARGDFQRMAWIGGKYVMMDGTSFACAHISGVVALIKERFPNTSFEEIRHILSVNASSEDFQKYISEENVQSEKTEKSISVISTVCETHLSDSSRKSILPSTDYSWIGKAAIYPYNKEMHSLIRFHNMLPFQITDVVDPIGKRLVGKDAGEVIGIGEFGTKISSDIEVALDKTDTLILGDVSELSRIYKKDFLNKYIQTALGKGKNIYSLNEVSEDKYPELYQLAVKQGNRIAYPNLIPFDQDIDKFRASIQYSILPVPILGVMGTGPRVGKFTVQLALRQLLLQSEYQVASLGTEPQSPLFGFEGNFPIGNQDLFKHIHMELHVLYLKKLIKLMYEDFQPEIIIVGGQSGIVPYSKKIPMDFNTLSSIIILLGTLPDAFILVVNVNDNAAYIRRTIQAIESFGTGKVIHLVVIDLVKQVIKSFGRSRVINQRMNYDELCSHMNSLEQEHGLPVSEVTTEKGQRKLVDAVIHYFSDKQS
jgi:peptide maturation system protein (TIGR04066 family)